MSKIFSQVNTKKIQTKETQQSYPNCDTAYHGLAGLNSQSYNGYYDNTPYNCGYQCHRDGRDKSKYSKKLSSHKMNRNESCQENFSSNNIVGQTEKSYSPASSYESSHNHYTSHGEGIHYSKDKKSITNKKSKKIKKMATSSGENNNLQQQLHYRQQQQYKDYMDKYDKANKAFQKVIIVQRCSKLLTKYFSKLN